MASSWSEVIAARNENRKELNLQGPDINKRIEEKGLDHNVFGLVKLNLLKIAGTPLKSISSDLGNLVQLTSLNLENNKLEELPSSIGKLTSLKFVDVSGNKLNSLPDSISQLSNLQSLNANLNCLTVFPDISGMKSLSYLSISRNELPSLPDGFCDRNLRLLSTIDAAHNQIQNIPSEISQLSHLIKLNLSHNKLEALPLELCECPKLKEVIIAENKMKDKKCLKLADHSTKALLAHLSSLLEKQRAAESGGKAKKGKSKSKKQKGGKQDEEDLIKDVIHTLKFNDSLTVSVTPGALLVRPYIVCCIIRNMDFGKSNNMFKRFITIQTKLHDSLCDKRQSATIASHDLKTIKGPLIYKSAPPNAIQIMPLFKSKQTMADVLMKDLRAEAEAYRKEKKRSTVSGIHKYLDLLKDKAEYPCLMDADGECISLPPITNSEKTKITHETTDVLVEVTGSKSLDACKVVMEELLRLTLETGVGTLRLPDKEKGSPNTDAKDNSEEVEKEDVEESEASSSHTQQSLTVEQVQIVDHEGRIRVVYPSRDDLLNEAFSVTRYSD